MRNNSNERKECERIWSEYKYLVLSKSQKIYKEIREYLKGDNINTNELNEYIKNL